jgi:tRNA (guanine9-N1)-methyltransferase
LVYLTADSENVITDLDSSKVYIIGGIVDHNRHKMITFNKAVKEGIAHGKLPIREHAELGDYSNILTVNHVFDLMLHYVSNGRNWKQSIAKTLPSRKFSRKEKAENKIQKRLEKIENSVSKDKNEDEEEEDDSEEGEEG